MSIDRRSVLRSAAGAVAIAVLPISAARAAMPAEVEAAVQDILAGRLALHGGITIDAPRMAENGAQVPLTIRVESPMSDADHVTAIHIVATANPTPEVGTFRLTPRLGRAEVMTRVRLAEAQEILVLAEMSDGRVLRADASIAVTVGGCAT